MADIENVISALECLANGGGTYDCLKFPCPYEFYGYTDCRKWEIARDALELLKERKKGQYVPCKIKTKTGKWDGERCSVCGAGYIGSAPHKWRFCPDCGAEMERRDAD